MPKYLIIIPLLLISIPVIFAAEINKPIDPFQQANSEFNSQSDSMTPSDRLEIAELMSQAQMLQSQGKQEQALALIARAQDKMRLASERQIVLKNNSAFETNFTLVGVVAIGFFLLVGVILTVYLATRKKPPGMEKASANFSLDNLK